MLKWLKSHLQSIVIALIPCILTFSTILFFGPLQASAQVTVGTPAFGSFGGGPDVVNLGNLNVQETTPVRHKAGRGTDFNWDLVYNSSVWGPTAGVWKLVSSTSIPGWQGLSPAGQAYISYSSQYSSGQCTNNGTTWYTWSS